MCLHDSRGSHINHGGMNTSSSWMPARKAIMDQLGDIQHSSDEDLEGKIRRLFQKLDRNMSGGIDSDELAEAMYAFGVRIDEQTLRIMMSHADNNHDGMIEWKEFFPLIKSIMNK
jgi:Ca2+-binding EF-hand superfamily protein